MTNYVYSRAVSFQLLLTPLPICPGWCQPLWWGAPRGCRAWSGRWTHPRCHGQTCPFLRAWVDRILEKPVIMREKCVPLLFCREGLELLVTKRGNENNMPFQYVKNLPFTPRYSQTWRILKAQRHMNWTVAVILYVGICLTTCHFTALNYGRHCAPGMPYT